MPREPLESEYSRSEENRSGGSIKVAGPNGVLLIHSRIRESMQPRTSGLLRETAGMTNDLINFTADESRYRALLSVSNVLVSQPDLHPVLHSVSVLLSKIVGCDTVALLLLNDDGERAQLYALESELRGPEMALGREFSIKNTVMAQVLENHKPMYIPSLTNEIASVPGLAEEARIRSTTSACMFPVSSARRKMGVLIFATSAGGNYSADDIELMRSVTIHVSTVLETALALDAAELYKRTLARERDRLKLILEINNHTITHLDVNALFRAASKSIHEYFDNAFTGFWVLEERSSHIELLSVECPRGTGFFDHMTTTVLTEDDIAKIRARTASILGPIEIDHLPGSLAKPFRDNSIISLACVPLVGTKGPLGIISVGSREKEAFGQDDIKLLSQIAIQISLALENALAYHRITFSCRRLEDERHYLESELQTEYNFEDIVGKSTAIKSVLEQVAIVAPTDSTVLLIGESGTGKELVARAIHNLSLRRAHTFVRLNCAAVPSGLLESELFGHEKGAFTGALAQKRGRIELADEGSLFLDEIGDIGIELQPKLLRVLQEREFERLGSNRTIRVDTRLIAATHRDLPRMVRQGEFRDDLFYRLNVFPIHIPPLRERKEDIPLLVHYFVATLSRKLRKSIEIIPLEVMDAITAFAWPGNVRELQNFVERSVILSRGETLAAPISELDSAMVPKDVSPSTFRGMEREVILNALRSAEGRLSGTGGAAEILGLKRTTLQRKMERLGIVRSDYI
jgi:formate hydrogenlyase transcriptional activator